MQNKTCTVEGVICTVCYCTGVIKNCLKIFSLALAAFVWEAAPCIKNCLKIFSLALAAFVWEAAPCIQLCRLLLMKMQ